MTEIVTPNPTLLYPILSMYKLYSVQHDMSPLHSYRYTRFLSSSRLARERAIQTLLSDSCSRKVYSIKKPKWNSILADTCIPRDTPMTRVT